MIEAILFDFVGVLLFPRADQPPDPLLDELDRTIGQVTDDRRFRAETMARYGLNDAAFDALLEHIVARYEPFPPLWELLPTLAARFPLGIINNGTALTLPRFRALYPIDRYFTFLSSALEGIRKPNPVIFQRAAARLGTPPERCLFMDDSPLNIAGAARCGMQTIWWESRELGFRHFLDTLAETEESL